MKKIILIIVSILLILLALIIVKFKIEDNQRNEIIKSCDIVFGVRINQALMNKYILYGYKNGEIFEIESKTGSKNFESNYPSFNRVTGTDDLVTYFDYNTWYKLYTDLDYGETGQWGIGSDEKRVNLFKKYYDNYEYDINQKEVFDKIMNCIFEKHKNDSKRDYYSVKYYIVTKNNYYISMYENSKHCICKYDNTNNTLNKIIEYNSGDLLYFKEN